MSEDYYGRIFVSDRDFDGFSTFTPITPGAPAVAPISIPVVAAPAPNATPGAPSFVEAVPSPTPVAAPTSLPIPDLDGRARYEIEDYVAAALALLPRGRIWTTDADSAQAKLFRGLCRGIARIDGVAGGLLAASVPGQVGPMLPEWEASLGLPDPCIGPDPDFSQRARQVRTRFTDTGGLSAARYIGFAASLGFEITITTYAPFRAGLSRAGDALADDAAYFLWGVTIVSATGEFSSDVLLCELERIKPAETSVFLLT
jgi:uncharacterized protein YmfQ (DUF2313 family)